VERVEEEARRRKAIAIHGLTISVGELAGVDPELFRTAYETFREGTLCEGAALEVVIFPASFSCPCCGAVFARGDVLRCAACDRPARPSDRSNALVLETIDMEVP
jgi:hydrogenase nickel incorporation protein HypA/HybF